MKRSGPLRHRSPTNSHPGENLELRERYRDENKKCEAWCVLTNYAAEMMPKILDRQTRQPQADDIHHLFHLRARWDLKVNLLALCRPIHLLDASRLWMKDFRVVCLFAKMMKRIPEEFDIRELNRAAGATRPDASPVLAWLETVALAIPSVDRMRQEIIETINHDKA